MDDVVILEGVTRRFGPVAAGGHRGRVLGVVVCEALLVTATSLRPMLHTSLGAWWPWMPASYLIGGGPAGTVLPAAVGMRRPAVELAG